MKNFVIQGDQTVHVVIRVQAKTLEEAIEKAEEVGEYQVVDFCPNLYSAFEWDGDKESCSELPEDDWGI